MLFDYVSDVHTDINLKAEYDWLMDRQSDVLIVGGDINNDTMKSIDIINTVAKLYRHVLFVDGNHEHYLSKRTVFDNMALLGSNMLDSNVTYLDGTNIVRFDDTIVIGCCGWYNWLSQGENARETQHSNWKRMSNDSRTIRFDIYPDTMARMQANHLKDHVVSFQNDDSVKHIVIVTHTAPRSDLLITDDPWYVRTNGSYCNTYMSDVVEADTNKKIRFWTYGHTHHHAYKMIDDIWYVNNAYGYKSERYREVIKYRGLLQLDTENPNPYM